METKGIHLLLVAAGKGVRAGGNLPKQYAPVAGKPVLLRTLEAFQAIPGLALVSVRVVIHPDHKALFHALDLPDGLIAIHGADERMESVFSGLSSFSDSDNDDFVLIHDAVRPVLRPDPVLRLLETLSGQVQAATLALPVTDTLVKSDAQDNLRDKLDRAHVWRMQTPQAFKIGAIREAHARARDEGLFFTDDATLARHYGHDVKLVPGDPDNIKLTYQEDFQKLEQILERKTSSYISRTASGFDVHAFSVDPASAAQVRLCGVDLPAPYPLKGHSDADVGLHALTDAILGTIAAGDIGEHFPPSDPQWKGTDSAVFLAHACHLLRANGGILDFLDVTLICETPKISPHKDAMRRRIAEICALSMDQVSVKATTTEKLGFTGRKEGIAAQACASVRVPMPSSLPPSSTAC